MSCASWDPSIDNNFIHLYVAQKEVGLVILHIGYKRKLVVIHITIITYMIMFKEL